MNEGFLLRGVICQDTRFSCMPECQVFSFYLICSKFKWVYNISYPFRNDMNSSLIINSNNRKKPLKVLETISEILDLKF